MRFGVVLPVEGAVTNGVPNISSVLDMADAAEKLNFDSVWVGERLLLSPRLEPFTTLGVIAGRTVRVNLGTAVILGAIRHPTVLAQATASIDRLSNGRLIIGMGAGANRAKSEFEGAGVPFHTRGVRLNEIIELLRRLWVEDSVEYNGRCFRLKKVSINLKPLQKGGPPIWIGGSSEGALKRTARLSDGWLAIEKNPEEYSNYIQKIEEFAQHARNVNKIHRAIYLSVNLGRDPREAQREAQRFLDTYYGTKLQINNFGVFGTSEECRAMLQRYREVGVETVVIRFASFSPLQQLDYFAANLLPLFNE